MPQALWINRQFEFSARENILPGIIERLEGTPMRLEAKVKGLPEEVLAEKHNSKFSLKEHIGHLSDLEPMWMGRLDEILAGQEAMRAADMKNKKTAEAGHGDKYIKVLLKEFKSARQYMVKRLRELPESAAFLASFHPRLQKTMRIMDLFQFVAEHDDHHLARMTELLDHVKP